MESRVSIFTLGVKNLEKSVRFYQEGLGLTLREDESSEYITFFQLNGLFLALYPSDLLADDAGVSLGKPAFSGITLAQNVASRQEVVRILQQAKK